MKSVRMRFITVAAAVLLGMTALSCKKSESKGGAGPTTQAADGMVVLKLDLPAVRITGTKEAMRGAHLPPGGPRPDKPLKVPRGLVNVAKGKPVSASDDEPVIGELEYITNGDKEVGDGRHVELGPGKQHVQIDLGGRFEIFAIVVWHDHHAPQVCRDVVVQVSDDEHFIEKKTVFNNDHDNSSGLGLGEDYEWVETYRGKIIPAAGVKPGTGVKGRYVRLYSNGSTANDENIYTEVEVHGRAVTSGKPS